MARLIITTHPNKGLFIFFIFISKAPNLHSLHPSACFQRLYSSRCFPLFSCLTWSRSEPVQSPRLHLKQQYKDTARMQLSSLQLQLGLNYIWKRYERDRKKDKGGETREYERIDRGKDMETVTPEVRREQREERKPRGVEMIREEEKCETRAWKSRKWGELMAAERRVEQII